MIARIRRRLVQHADRLTDQPHPRAPQTEIADLGRILLTAGVVGFDEEGEGGGGVEEGAVQRQFENVGRRGGGGVGAWRGQIQGLGRWEVGGGGEVEVRSVPVQVDCLGGGGGWGGVQEEAVQAALASESGGEERRLEWSEWFEWRWKGMMSWY